MAVLSNLPMDMVTAKITIDPALKTYTLELLKNEKPQRDSLFVKESPGNKLS